MNQISLSKQIINLLSPFLRELLDPGSLSWFEEKHKDGSQRKLAEEYWKILFPVINSNLKLMGGIKNYLKNPEDQNLKNLIIEQLAIMLEENPYLQNTLDPQQPVNSSFINIGGNVSKSNVVLGNNNSITNYSVSVGNVQNVIINQSGINRNAEIKDVWINLALPNGTYPTFYFLDRSGAYSMLGEKTWWEPLGYSYDKLMEVLIKEINKWTNTGWEIIENDLDNLWVFDHGYNESFFTYLTRLAIPAGTTLKHWRRYRGAQFHVRRFI